MAEEPARQYDTPAPEPVREEPRHAPEQEPAAASIDAPPRKPPHARRREEVPVIAEPEPIDPAKPARKGWWQRKLLG